MRRLPYPPVPSAGYPTAEGTLLYSYRCRLAGVTVTAACSSPSQAQTVADLWEQLFMCEQPPTTAQQVSITLEFQRDLPLPQAVRRGREVYRSSSLLVIQTPGGFFLRCGGSWLELDLAAAAGKGVLTAGFARRSRYQQREFFLLSLLMLLRPRGRYGIHANALESGGQGILLVGSSGSGKTTLTLSLVRRGWRYLSDDASVLEQRPDGVEVLALRRGFSCTPATEAFFPELRESSPLYSAQGKRILDLEEVFPGQHHSHCRPEIIIFPTVARQPRTVLEPLEAPEALLRLARESAGILSGGRASQRQLELLGRLVQQARSYRALLGTDVYRTPESLSSRLLELAGGKGG